MDFRELQYLLAIAKHQNITKAAESLYVSQPTLSKFLSSLEASLGQKLFQKNGNRFLLTYAGERYVARAKEILQLKSDLDEEMADIVKQNKGVLNIAGPPMRTTTLIPSVLVEFEKMYPNVQVNIREGNSVSNDQAVIDGTADLTFYSMPRKPNPLLEYKVICLEELLLCAQKNHPIRALAKTEPGSPYPMIDLKDITGERLISLLPGQRTRDFIDSYLKEHDITFEKTFYIGSMPVIMDLVSRGYGISFLYSSHLTHHHIGKTLDYYRFSEEQITAEFVVAKRKGSYLPGYARDFIELLRTASL